jgi:hypothetical protein
MRVQQASLADKNNPQYLNALQAAKKIIRGDGSPASSVVKASHFYRGLIMGMYKEFFKCAFYKGVLIVGAPGLAGKGLSYTSLASIVSPAQYSIVQAVFAGAIAGFGDAFIGGPLESGATFLAAAQGEHSKRNYRDEFKAEKTVWSKIARNWRGLGATSLKGTIAFSTMFLTKQPINQWVGQVYDLPDTKHKPWQADLTVAVLSGCTVALTSTPFDIIKTQSQMPNPSNKSIVGGIVSNVSTYGLRGVTAGMPLKFVMVTLGWALTSFITDKVKAEKPVQQHAEQAESLRAKM